MPSLVYFKFKSNLQQQNIPFEGSAISVSDLKSAIRIKNGMKSNDFELIVMTTDGKDYSDKDLIPAYSSVIIRRMPLLNIKPANKTLNPENFKKRDPYKLMRNSDNLDNLQIMNLATSNLSEEQKEDFVAEYSSKMYNILKRPQVGPLPQNYLCNRCNVAGHWIKDCPGIADKNGKMLESKLVKRPSGIPTSNLMEVDSNTPNTYLTADGRYVVNTKNHEAYLKGKKDKRPFSQEENPPRPVNAPEKPPCLVCIICDEILRDPISTSCCRKVFCRGCAVDAIFDEQSDYFHRCPNCTKPIDRLDSLTDEILFGDILHHWRQKKLTDGDLQRMMPQEERTVVNNVTVATVTKAEYDDDLTNEIFGFSDKENGTDRIMLVNESYVYANTAVESAVAVDLSDVKEEVKLEMDCHVIPVLGARREDNCERGRPLLFGRYNGRWRRDRRSISRQRTSRRSRDDGSTHRRRRSGRSRRSRSHHEKHRKTSKKHRDNDSKVTEDSVKKNTEAAVADRELTNQNGGKLGQKLTNGNKTIDDEKSRRRRPKDETERCKREPDCPADLKKKAADFGKENGVKISEACNDKRSDANEDTLQRKRKESETVIKTPKKSEKKDKLKSAEKKIERKDEGRHRSKSRDKKRRSDHRSRSRHRREHKKSEGKSKHCEKEKRKRSKSRSRSKGRRHHKSDDKKAKRQSESDRKRSRSREKQKKSERETSKENRNLRTESDDGKCRRKHKKAKKQKTKTEHKKKTKKSKHK